jgi:hypothetical protein
MLAFLILVKKSAIGSIICQSLRFYFLLFNVWPLLAGAELKPDGLPPVNYQLDFFTPGIKPWWAIFLKQIRQRPKSL